MRLLHRPYLTTDIRMVDATAHKRIERLERSKEWLLEEYDQLKAENEELKAEYDLKVRERVRTSIALGAHLCGKSVDEARPISDRMMKALEEEGRRILEERKSRPS